VDELAHTNAPGSERSKRWQDVEALLLCGIDVYSTLNIQHLESLNDLVADLTGVVVRERIPNRVLERADAVVLVDVTPETLRQRLEEGKVYARDKIQQALTHFFQHRHLVALRELSLREVADRVEEQAPQATRLLRERVMVCVPTSGVAQRLLRRAARLAAALDAPLFALTVQMPNRLLSREEAKVLEECERLCADLGATFHYVGNTPEASTHMLYVGISESMSPGILGFSLVSLSFLFVAVAVRRLDPKKD
jgi:two-component system sensor histidine kinase KdpD